MKRKIKINTSHHRPRWWRACLVLGHGTARSWNARGGCSTSHVVAPQAFRAPAPQSILHHQGTFTNREGKRGGEILMKFNIYILEQLGLFDDKMKTSIN